MTTTQLQEIELKTTEYGRQLRAQTRLENAMAANRRRAQAEREVDMLLARFGLA